MCSSLIWWFIYRGNSSTIPCCIQFIYNAIEIHQLFYFSFWVNVKCRADPRLLWATTIEAYFSCIINIIFLVCSIIILVEFPVIILGHARVVGLYSFRTYKSQMNKYLINELLFGIQINFFASFTFTLGRY